jgi:hypothetical protein
MRIHSIIWIEQFVEKLEFKHGVFPWEVEEVLFGECRVRLVSRGNINMDENKRHEIPAQFDSIKEAGEFWDTHSAADYWDEMEDIEIEFDLERHLYLVPVREELYQRIKSYADKQDQSVEELIERFLENELVRMRAA